MSCFYHISTPQDELKYLKTINELNNKLQSKYDNDFFTKNNMQKRYENIFQPITKPLQKSLQLQQEKQDQEEQQYPQPIKQSMTPSKSSTDVDFTIKNKQQQGKKLHFNDFDISRFVTNPQDYGIVDKNFGITRVGKTKKKNTTTYKYLGNTVQITGKPSSMMKIIAPIQLKQTLEIPTQRIWDLIVLDYPFHEITHADLIEYGKILKANNFESWLHNKPNTMKKRTMVESKKYMDIILPALEAVKDHLGSGIYTSFAPTTFLYQQNRKKKKDERCKQKRIKRGKGIAYKKKVHIEFFPANKRVLLKKLIYLLGEYRCGNTRVLRNEIVPIINYLKSQKALPAKFDKKYMNWIYD